MQSDINKNIEKLVKAVTIIGRDIETIKDQIRETTKITSKMIRIYEKEVKEAKCCIVDEQKEDREKLWHETTTT